MIPRRAALRYAKSLLDIARDRGKVEEVYADMLAISDLIGKSRSFYNLLHSPLVHAQKKDAIFLRIFGERVCGETMGLTRLLVRKGRESMLEDVAHSFIEKYKTYKGILDVEFVSPYSIDNELLRNILQKLEIRYNQKIEVSVKINPELIGGFVLRIKDKYLDTTVKSIIEKIRREFIKNPYMLN